MMFKVYQKVAYLDSNEEILIFEGTYEDALEYIENLENCSIEESFNNYSVRI